MKTVFVTFQNSKTLFCKGFKDNIEVYSLFIDNFFVKAIRKVCLSLRINLPSCAYNKQIKHISCDRIIVFESAMQTQYFNYLKKIHSDKHIILWFWNPVNKTVHPSIAPKGIDVWSYSPVDCEKYGLKYNDQFYSKSFVKSNLPIKYDIMYVGSDKGRRAWLEAFEEKCRQAGLKTAFTVFAKYNAPDNLSYEQIIELIRESRAILDYYTDSTAGLSLRPLEALFFGKKLITNNSLIQNFDFYCKENIFIIGKDNDGELKDFICSPFKPVDEKIVLKYDINEWLKRFK